MDVSAFIGKVTSVPGPDVWLSDPPFVHAASIPYTKGAKIVLKRSSVTWFSAKRSLGDVCKGALVTALHFSAFTAVYF